MVGEPDGWVQRLVQPLCECELCDNSRIVCGLNNTGKVFRTLGFSKHFPKHYLFLRPLVKCRFYEGEVLPLLY